MNTSTFLTFVGDQCGKAKEAIDFYTSVFPNSMIKDITYYKEGEPGGAPDLVKFCVFTINGVEYMASENNYKHAWSFSPGVSIFIRSQSEEETKTIFEALQSNGGKIMVPIGDYGTSEYGLGQLFGWCEDRYGVSWQFSLDVA